MHPGSELRYFPQIYAAISLPTEFLFWLYPKMEKNGLVGHPAKLSVPTHTGHLSVSNIIEDIPLHDSRHSRCTSEVYEDDKYFAFKSLGWVKM
jgi:hypothetical protein